ncbi:MAG: histidinol-phosphate transaminase [Bacteroidales bacterium]|nr:histidinol-phosphate transaminase [Bacteroidales bacterium]
MKRNPLDLVRDNIRSLVPYSSARDEFSGTASIYMDANENPYNEPLNRYPDPQQTALKSKLSAIRNFPVSQIFLGNGSDEAIDILIRIFCEPRQDNAMMIEPSYGMYAVCAHINNVEIRKVMLNPDFTLDPDRVLSAADEHTKILFLCSPNNPTSNLLEKKSVTKIIERINAIVVIDEAYIDFSHSPGFSEYINDYSNLVVLQTFSKSWALAGIRLGMAIAGYHIISYMNRVKYPYNINRLTINKALEELEHSELRSEWIQEIIQERERVTKELGSFPFVRKIYPSDANFLLVKVKNPRALYNYLLENGIIIRDRSQTPLCEGCVRITIGTRKENNCLIEALEKMKL